jgi:RNA polymerase sigma-70 factor (ECF subfamily)
MEPLNSGRDEVLRLFLKHQVMLAGFVYTLVEDWEIVEEALQETAVFLCSRWQDFTPGTNFGAWARTLARMRCRDVLQRRRRAAATPLEPVLHDLAAPITPEEWEQHGTFSPRHKQALARCVQSLPADHRQVVEMHYQQRQACDRIAAALTKSVEAVYMMLSRIRKRLKQCVEQRLAQEAL